MDAFFRHCGNVSLVFQSKDVYMKIPIVSFGVSFGTIRELCQICFEYAKYYTNIVFKRNTDTDLKKKLYEDIIDLRMGSILPFLLRKFIMTVCRRTNLHQTDRKKVQGSFGSSYVLRRVIWRVRPIMNKEHLQR